jgi:hypothetical protein
MHDRDVRRDHGRVCALRLFVECTNATDTRPIWPPGAVCDAARATGPVRS